MRRSAVIRVLLALGVLLTLGEAASADLPQGVLEGLGKGAIQVRARRQLAFGTVIAGIPSSVPWTTPEAGHWFIRGDSGAEVQVDFVSLPSTLQNGGAAMPILFSTSDAGYAAKNQQRNGVSFDPNVGIVTRLDASSGHLHIWIGGTVAPLSNQQAGAYVADVVLDVYYTGN